MTLFRSWWVGFRLRKVSYHKSHLNERTDTPHKVRKQERVSVRGRDACPITRPASAGVTSISCGQMGATSDIRARRQQHEPCVDASLMRPGCVPSKSGLHCHEARRGDDSNNPNKLPLLRKVVGARSRVRLCSWFVGTTLCLWMSHKCMPGVVKREKRG